MPAESLTRRRLLAAFGGAGVLLAAPTWALSKKKPGNPLNVALAGLGSYASEQLAPGLALTKHCKLAGIVTGTASKIPQWQVKYGIADRNVYNYENFHRIADNDDIDVGRSQDSSATHDLKAAISASIASLGVFQPSVWRGRVFISKAM